MGAHIGEWTRDHTDQCPARLSQECLQGTGHRLREPHPLHPVRSWDPEEERQGDATGVKASGTPRTQGLFSQRPSPVLQKLLSPWAGKLDQQLLERPSEHRDVPTTQPGHWAEPPLPPPSSPSSLPAWGEREGGYPAG